MTGGEALLEVSNLVVSYGHIEAVRGVDLRVDTGEIRTLVGANGAGKSSTLLALSGLVVPRSGKVRFAGDDITAMAAHRIVGRGLVQVAEGRAILTTMSVRENLELGAYRRRDTVAIADDMERVLDLFPRLRERLGGFAGNLSGGEQQMLAIGRALLARPRMLLLDEPSMGLAPIAVQGILEALRRIHAQGITIFLVEQNVRQALKLASHGYVIETGRIVLDGPSAQLLDDPRVVAAYLGG